MAGNNVREIKTRLTVEGEKVLKAALEDNKAEAKRLGSEMSLLTAEFDEDAESQEYLTKKGELLARQLANAKEKVEIYAKQLEQAEKKQADLDKGLEETAERLKEQEKALAAAADRYGEGSEEVEKLSEAVKESRTALENQEAKLLKADKAVQQMAANVNNAQVNVVKMSGAVEKNNASLRQMDTAAGASAKKNDLLKAAVSDLSGKFGVTLPESVTTAMGSLSGMAGPIGIAIGVVAAAVNALVEASKALINLVQEQSQWAQDLDNMSQQVGVSTDKLQAWEYAASQMGVPIDAMIDGMKELTLRVGEVAEGNDDASNAFGKLNVNVRDSNGELRSGSSLMEEVLTKLSRIPNEAERAAVMNTLFGESYLKLNPVVKENGKFVEETSDAYRKGIVQNTETIDSLKNTNAAFSRLNDTVKAVKTSVADSVDESIVAALDTTSEAVTKLGSTLVSSGAAESLAKCIEYLAQMLDLFSSIASLTGVTEFFESMSFAMEIMARGVEEVTKWIDNLLSKLTELQGSVGNFVANQVLEYISPSVGVSGHAAGTPYAPGGVVRVGEYGPETVYLPKGSRVVNANDTAAQSGGKVVNNYITVQVPNLEKFLEIAHWYENRDMDERTGAV